LEPLVSLEPRNPWFGVSMWREFCYDVTHPLLYLRRGWNGTKATIVWMFR